MWTVREEPWRYRLTSSCLQEVVAFKGDDLILGCGTVLWTAASDPANTFSLRTDAAYDAWSRCWSSRPRSSRQDGIASTRCGFG